MLKKKTLKIIRVKPRIASPYQKWGVLPGLTVVILLTPHKAVWVLRPLRWLFK